MTVETVLGTPLEPARDDDRPRTFLLSDLHVPHEGGRVLDDLRAVLRGAAQHAPATRVLILGDLFDYLTGAKHLAVGAYPQVVDALAEATRAGVSVAVLHGNRDFMLDRAFERMCGARVVAGGLRFRLGGRACVAVHGDELCLLDRPYLRVKRVLRHPLAKAFSRSLPLGAALRVGAWTRGRAGARTPPPGSDRYEPVAEAMRAVFARGVDLVVFGHIHRPARGVFEGRGEYCILPAFDDRGVHLRFEGGALRYCAPDGAIVEDYPPRAFPAMGRAEGTPPQSGGHGDYACAQAYTDLRAQVLGLTAEQLGLAGTSTLAALMETGYPDAVATLVAVADGSASIYISHGGGVIGAGEHPPVASASRDFVKIAGASLGAMARASTCPLPRRGAVRFHVVTGEGSFTAEGVEEELGRGRHELAPLFGAAHRLIAAIRSQAE